MLAIYLLLQLYAPRLPPVISHIAPVRLNIAQDKMAAMLRDEKSLQNSTGKTSSLKN